MGSKLNMECSYCGFQYRNLRTGLTYQQVYEMLWSYNDDPSTWRYKRRHTVLGKWHQLKLELWAEHVEGCAALAAERKAS